ncbi:MAG: DNA replication/repair protein RecF [Steroidobacter sp.]
MLSSLEVDYFRCIERARLEFDPRVSAIVGANASGKTSLLEAIYFLGHGRSFRVAQREKLIQTGRDSLRVVGRIQAGERCIVAGAEFAPDSSRLQLDGHVLTGHSEVAAILPMQVIDPGVHRLIEEGSARRRRLLDWGVFHVKHDFLVAWRRYQRALRQRNAALRLGAPLSMVLAWDAELSASSRVVDEQRQTYFELLRPLFREWAGELVGQGAELEYRRGWSDSVELAEVLAECRSRDLRLRMTSVGAHRADLQFTIAGVPARDRISRGQQKLLASAFVLAQVALHTARSERRTCLLLDDPAAELDVDNLGKLLGALTRIPAQLIVTAVNEAGLRGLPVGRRFHVEQGRVQPML